MKNIRIEGGRPATVLSGGGARRHALSTLTPVGRSHTLRRAVAAIARTRWFAALGRQLASVDLRLFRASGGRLTILGPQGFAMPPTLLLTTTGRRTGRSRTTPVMYLADGDRVVVTSENFGQSRPAAWPLNLDADQHATVELGAHAYRCEARRATRDELARYWPRFLELWPAHGAYHKRSGARHMFILTLPTCTRDSSSGTSDTRTAA